MFGWRSLRGLLADTTQALFTAALGLLLIGCGLGISEEMKFPPIEVVAPMQIAKVDVFPEQSICVIERASVIEQLIAHWAHDYDRGWKRSYVSLAPTYRISVGSTEILVLRRGLAVVVETIDGKRVTYGRELPEGIAERIVHEACSAE